MLTPRRHSRRRDPTSGRAAQAEQFGASQHEDICPILLLWRHCTCSWQLVLAACDCWTQETNRHRHSGCLSGNCSQTEKRNPHIRSTHTNSSTQLVVRERTKAALLKRKESHPHAILVVRRQIGGDLGFGVRLNLQHVVPADKQGREARILLHT